MSQFSRTVADGDRLRSLARLSGIGLGPHPQANPHPGLEESAPNLLTVDVLISAVNDPAVSSPHSCDMSIPDSGGCPRPVVLG